MIADCVVTIFAIAGLFLVRKYYMAAMLIWSGTNLWWLIWNFRIGNYSQAVMFAAFTISCSICYFKK